jgi:hypothetical protein
MTDLLCNLSFSLIWFGLVSSKLRNFPNRVQADERKVHSTTGQHWNRGAKSGIRTCDSSLRRSAPSSTWQPESGNYSHFQKLHCVPHNRYLYKERAPSALKLLKSQLTRPIHLGKPYFFPFLVGGHTWKVPTLDNEKWGMYLQWRVTRPVLTMRKANRHSRYAACVNLYTESSDEKYIRVSW